MHCPTLMIQGTGSDAGKSLLATALCRALYRRGIRVAPFKPQNMALNSAVTCDGGEIGRAQAVQAMAAGLEPHTDMNPVLLKPTGEMGAQVIVHGRAVADLSARDYHAYKPRALQAVLESYRRLGNQYQAIVVEGAGSPAEINLREGDIANMGFAEAVDCPVILLGDIDKGGVFAQLVGTLDLLSDSERERVKGLVINKFRGDIGLLQPGLEWLEQRTGKPVLGVLPYLPGLYLEAEDGINPLSAGPRGGGCLKVVVPAPPRISNHTDFDPLRLHPQVDFRYLRQGDDWPAADLVILPGSKNVRADLAWLQQQGWGSAIRRHLRYGGKLIGICGGLQMLGRAIHDPHGVEGEPGSAAGLGLLELETVLEPEKQLGNVTGTFLPNGAAVRGYEIHAGISSGAALEQPALRLDDGRSDGALSQDGQIMATYVHGLFDQHPDCLLGWAGLNDGEKLDYGELRREAFERLADCVEAHLDMEMIGRLLGLA